MPLPVTVGRVLYPPATEKDADWFILKTDQGIVKGKMAWRPAEMQKLILDGEWASYRGEREYKFKSAMLDVPTDPRAQLHYVCERAKGVGPALEIAIWEARGADWQKIGPGEIKKLSGKVFEDFRQQVEGLARDGEQVKAVAWLMSKGATQSMACAAWERWERQMVGVITDDPFRLTELPNYGFKNVDGEIRMAFGISDDDPRRIRAAVIYAIRRLTDDGSTLVVWSELLKHCLGMLGGMQNLICGCTRDLFDDGELVGWKQSQGIALAADYRAETSILEYVSGI